MSTLLALAQRFKEARAVPQRVIDFRRIPSPILRDGKIHKEVFR